MAESRVVPSGKVYRQMFEAQVQLSRTLHESRKRRELKDSVLLASGGLSRSGNDYGSGQQKQRWTRAQSDTKRGSQDRATRDQLFSGSRTPSSSEELSIEEEIRGLPDVIVTDRPASDIIQRMMEKKQKNHSETVSQLHHDLSVLSLEFENRIRQTGKDVLLQLSEYNVKVKKHMQAMDALSDLERFTLQDLHALWEAVREESEKRRSWVKKLDSTFTEYESERTAMIAALLRKYTGLLEKISYVMPPDVHRLMDSEAMMINQALLANRRAVAKLYLNLMEQDLEKELSDRLHWEDKLQDWKKHKVRGVVDRFKDFMGTPRIQQPPEVQASLEHMRELQLTHNQQRCAVFQSLSALIPPSCSKKLVTEWYDSLTSINQEIDCMQIDLVKKLASCYEAIWQECLAEVDKCKEEIFTYGLSAEEVQTVINAEFLSVIGRSQSQAEERIASMDRAFEGLARRVALLSRSVFKVCRGAVHLWEAHSSGLQKAEQELLEQLDVVRTGHNLNTKKKEANLDVLLDKLRQESTEETLGASLEKTLASLDEVKHGYLSFHKEEMEVVDCFPGMVLEELQTYSSAVSRFFNVEQTYSLDPEVVQSQCPLISLDSSGRVIVKRKKVIRQGKKGLQRNPDTNRPSFLSLFDEDAPDSYVELWDSQSKEVFVTRRGQRYSSLSWVCPQEGDPASSCHPDTQLVSFPASLLCQLLTDVRLAYFDHLEERFDSALSNSMVVLAARKEAMQAEHELRMHLHQPRARRIEMDVHNARATELVVHRERVDRHCKGVLQALVDYRADFQELQVRQNKLTEDFKTQIYSLEDVFVSATKSDVLVGLCATLQTSLDKHVEVIQMSQRQFRHSLEAKLEGLRQGNAKLLTSFKLFSEGGNFTPKEIEVYHKRLEKMTKRIDATEENVVLDMDVTESKCLDQAKDVVSKFEEKFHYLAVDMKFLEKIQSMLTNTQVQIKSEACKCNTQKRKISALLLEREEMIHPYAGPEKAVSMEVFTSNWSVLEELKARCQYLECFLDPSMATPLPDCPLQGSFAVAARHKARRQEKTGIPALAESLLQPSRMGVSFLDDPAVGLVKGLLRFSKPTPPQEFRSEAGERGSAAATVRLPSPVGSGQKQGKIHSQLALDALHRQSSESVSAQSVRRFSKPTRFDKRFHVFGSKPDDDAIATFKSVVAAVLWKTNDILLLLAEDFYKKKDRRQVTRPQYLQDTFELCAEDINKRLLAYQSQAHDYLNDCVQEFRQQLEDFEGCLSKLPEVLVCNLEQQHLTSLDQEAGRIRQSLQCTLQASEDMKKEHARKLSVRLSHPACEAELQALSQSEAGRQKKLAEDIHNSQLELQASLRKQGEEFVSSLASLTENLLFQMDNLLTVDRVLPGHAEMKKENVTTLLRRKQADTLQEKSEAAPLQRGSRTWPGIAHFTTSPDEPAMAKTITASITTATTTLGHLRTVEARDSAYQKYEQRYRKVLEQAVEENRAQQRELQLWVEHWNGQLTTLAQINAE
ncbi:coiled-coil domain-containing protein 180 [Hypomesus transpacificus]|uniref:coiled-coil domain-containing protein 180 n=1 Tax=Hypomesus transpacificus TaxID=137520 RepID=UPI001F085E1A|nr:coiled-coil domain-containing protein 180 [Hypomesus transpacificus]